MKLYVILATIFVISQYIHGEDREDSFECKENASYILDGTYPCECVPALNFTLNCDLSKCPDKPVIKVDCALGSSWKVGCTECWCRTIGSICSSEYC